MQWADWVHHLQADTSPGVSCTDSLTSEQQPQGPHSPHKGTLEHRRYDHREVHHWHARDTSYKRPLLSETRKTEPTCWTCGNKNSKLGKGGNRTRSTRRSRNTPTTRWPWEQAASGEEGPGAPVAGEPGERRRAGGRESAERPAAGAAAKGGGVLRGPGGDWRYGGSRP